ncbi:hypothetical protein Tco_1217789 [Tanacetum coccineum]
MRLQGIAKVAIGRDKVGRQRGEERGTVLEEKKDAEDPGNEDGNPSEEGERFDQDKDANVNSTKNINTVSPTVNVASIENNAIVKNIVYGCVDDPNMLDLEEIGRFSDAKNDDSGADINNLDTYFQVSPIPTTRIHKDHPVEQIIGDLNSAPQTRRMTKNLKEHGEGCQFLGCRLISWQCKKQTVVANFTTEAEYIAASNCCGQVLWIQNQLLDYGYNFMQTKIHIDNETTICIVKNPIFHSKIKNIEIRHHFIKDSNEKKLIQMIKIHTDQNVADLLTKAFYVSRFQYLIASIGMLNL